MYTSDDRVVGKLRQKSSQVVQDLHWRSLAVVQLATRQNAVCEASKHENDMRKRGCGAWSKRVQSIEPKEIQDQAGEQEQARAVSNVLQVFRQSSPCDVLSVQQLQRRGQVMGDG